MNTTHTPDGYYRDPHNHNRLVKLTATHRDVGNRPAVRVTRTKTLCEELGIGSSLKSTAYDFCRLTDLYINEKITWTSWRNNVPVRQG